jgi:Zn-dependent protease
MFVAGVRDNPAMDIGQIIQTMAVYALPVLLAITLHEAAHAYAARRFGDDTAYILGRMTLNPIKHIDPIGTIAMPLFLYVVTSGAFLFGYAKPVPVRFGNLKNPKRDMIWVAAAGPLSNLFMALCWGAFELLLRAAGVDEPFFIRMAQAGVLVNVIMFVFNLFPLPPLDGGRVLAGLLPRAQAALLDSMEPFGFFIVMGLVVAGVLSAIWMQPGMTLTYEFLNVLLAPLAALLR